MSIIVLAAALLVLGRAGTESPGTMAVNVTEGGEEMVFGLYHIEDAPDYTPF